MEARVYVIEDEKMSFNWKNFKQYFDSYCASNKITGQALEQLLAEKLNVSSETIHKWRYGKSNPSDIELVKGLAGVVNASDYRVLLKKLDGGNRMNKLTDRQIAAVKRIYDVCIWYLHTFDNSDGFNDYWLVFSRQGSHNPEIDIDELVDKLWGKVNLVLDQEYFDLRDTKIYEELCEFVSEDLVDIYAGKTSYAYRFEAVVDGNPTTSEDYNKAMIHLNSIIEAYI